MYSCGPLYRVEVEEREVEERKTRFGSMPSTGAISCDVPGGFSASEPFEMIA
jgi:hypothetical protein